MVATDDQLPVTESPVATLLRTRLEGDLPASVAAAMDTRVAAAIARTSVRAEHPNRRARRRIIVALAVAAVIATAAAAPLLQHFQGWGQTFDRVFALSTPIGQSVTYDGYR